MELQQLYFVYCSRHGDTGYFVEPTIFADVTDEMKICQEEIFGPVLSIQKFSTVDEAIDRANKYFFVCLLKNALSFYWNY